ncbi:MAG: hypothetical protein ACREDQ_05295, partial [Limisphaerales bacterium]
MCYFPSPLALSPKERENHRQSIGESDGIGTLAGRTLLFPLPKGEGQGEGKPGNVSNPTAVTNPYFFQGHA